MRKWPATIAMPQVPGESVARQSRSIASYIAEWCLIEVFVQSADSHTGFVVHSIAAQVIAIQQCLLSLAS